MAFISAAPLHAASALPTSRVCPARQPTPAFRSTFLSTRVHPLSSPAPAPARTTSNTPRMEFEISEGVSFKVDVTIIALALAGWILPSSIPSGIPLTKGTGLSQAFFASMNENLARFPKGPAQDDPFWLLCFLWHVGLFACLIFGTIGVNSRKASES